MRKKFDSLQAFWGHLEGVLSGAQLLEEGEWEERSAEETQFASFPDTYHAEWVISVPSGKWFRLRLWGDRDRKTDAATCVRWDQTVSMHKDGMITCVEDGKIARVVSEEHDAAVAACNAAGHNIYSPFGLMDR